MTTTAFLLQLVYKRHGSLLLIADHEDLHLQSQSFGNISTFRHQLIPSGYIAALNCATGVCIQWLFLIGKHKQPA